MYKPLYFIVFLFSLFLTTVSYAQDLPDLGSPSQSYYSQQEIKELSESYMREIQQSPRYIHDPLLNEYIQNLGDKLVRNSGSKQAFHFFILNIPQINAFAGPGGYVGVYSGLMLASRNESELAAVMAHEIAHVTQYHILRSIAHEKHWRIPLLAGAIAAAALGYVNPALGEGAAMLGLSGYIQNNMAFTRSHEKEADRIGIHTLEKAGFDPNSMANFFKQLQLHDRFSVLSDVPAILRSHPLNAERIADAENRAAQFTRHPYQNSLRYKLMKARIRVLSTDNIQATIHYFKQQPTTPANRYGLALAYLVAQSFTSAQHILQPLTQKYPNNPVYTLALATTQLALKHNQQALQLLSGAYQNFPDSRPVLITYADALIKAGHSKQAADLLQQAIYDAKNDVYLWQLLAIAQDKSGQQASAYFSLAQSYILLQETVAAHRYLKQATKLTTKNSLLSLRINDLQKQIGYINDIKQRH